MLDMNDDFEQEGLKELRMMHNFLMNFQIWTHWN